jgi:hypothetical protein
MTPGWDGNSEIIHQVEISGDRLASHYLIVTLSVIIGTFTEIHHFFVCT